MINGQTYDFESIKLNTPSGIVNSATSIKYKYSKDIDVISGQNGKPRGYVRKKFSGDVTIVMSRAEYNILVAVSGVHGVLGMAPFPIIVSYANIGLPLAVDTLTVKVTDVDNDNAEEKEAEVTLTAKMTDIPLINGKPAVGIEA